jgi:hypothetical protein
MHRKKTIAAVFSLARGTALMALAFIILMGWGILVLAALNTLAFVLPVLVSVVNPGRALVTGVFAAIVVHPLATGGMVTVGGYIIGRFHLADWL